MAHLFRRIGFSTLFALLPFIAFAQAPATFKGGIEMIITWVQGAFTLLFGIMWVGLAWGVVLYLSNSEDEKKLAEIKGYLFWGVIGVTVVFAIWGIIGIVHESIFGGGWGIPLISPPA
jgi:hypothetical protein